MDLWILKKGSKNLTGQEQKNEDLPIAASQRQNLFNYKKDRATSDPEPRKPQNQTQLWLERKSMKHRSGRYSWRFSWGTKSKHPGRMRPRSVTITKIGEECQIEI